MVIHIYLSSVAPTVTLFGIGTYEYLPTNESARLVFSRWSIGTYLIYTQRTINNVFKGTIKQFSA